MLTTKMKILENDITKNFSNVLAHQLSFFLFFVRERHLSFLLEWQELGWYNLKVYFIMNVYSLLL